jgi:cation transport regulator ChaC
VTPAGLLALAWRAYLLQLSATELWFSSWWLAGRAMWLSTRARRGTSPRPGLAAMYRDTVRDLYQGEEEAGNGRR